MGTIALSFLFVASTLFAWLVFILCRNQNNETDNYIKGLLKDIGISLIAGLIYAFVFAIAFAIV